MIMLTLHSQPLALCDVSWPTQDITYVAKVCLQDCSTRSQSCCLVSEIATIDIQPWGHLSDVRRSGMFCLWNLTSKVHRGRRFTGDIMEQRLLRQTGKTIFDDFKPHMCISQAKARQTCLAALRYDDAAASVSSNSVTHTSTSSGTIWKQTCGSVAVPPPPHLGKDDGTVATSLRKTCAQAHVYSEV